MALLKKLATLPKMFPFQSSGDCEKERLKRPVPAKSEAKRPKNQRYL